MSVHAVQPAMSSWSPCSSQVTFAMLGAPKYPGRHRGKTEHVVEPVVKEEHVGSTYPGTSDVRAMQTFGSHVSAAPHVSTLW